MIIEDLSNIEELIEAGKSNQARKKLKGLTQSKIARNRLVAAAHLCRRVGLAELGLKFLKPVVRPTNPQIKPTAKEIAEYGHLLSSIGGSEECISLLNNPHVLNEEPKAPLYLAFAYFAQWNYQAAIPHLVSYLEGIERGSYSYRIGQVNYAAALVANDDLDIAQNLLYPLIESFDRENLRILAGNCRELLAQTFFKQQKFDPAIPLLEQAHDLLGNKYPDALFVQKWQTFIAIANEGNSEANQMKFLELKKEAQRVSHWETLRDLDLQYAVLTQNAHLFNNVYFGSPLNHYKAKLVTKYNIPVKQSFTRHFSDDSAPNIIHNSDLLDKGDDPLFKSGSLYHRLFLTLASDFYRPVRTPTLFAKIYPDEYFDPESSTQKVKMLISRLRKQIAPLNFSVQEIKGNGYQLCGEPQVGLIYHQKNLSYSANQDESRLGRIRNEVAADSFKSADVAKVLNLSQRSASRWLNEMCEKGELTKTGERKGTRYLFLVEKKAS